jgi:hypothetical protein
MRVIEETKEVILSLKDYKSMIKRIEKIEKKIEEMNKNEYQLDKEERSVEQQSLGEETALLMADVTEEEWDKIPTDGSIQHDHYIYGTPKRKL